MLNEENKAILTAAEESAANEDLDRTLDSILRDTASRNPADRAAPMRPMMTRSDFPRELYQALREHLHLPGYVQDLTLIIKRGQPVEVQCTFNPYAPTESAETKKESF